MKSTIVIEPIDVRNNYCYPSFLVRWSVVAYHVNCCQSTIIALTLHRLQFNPLFVQVCSFQNFRKLKDYENSQLAGSQAIVGFLALVRFKSLTNTATVLFISQLLYHVKHIKYKRRVFTQKNIAVKFALILRRSLFSMRVSISNKS